MLANWWINNVGKDVTSWVLCWAFLSGEVYRLTNLNELEMSAGCRLYIRWFTQPLCKGIRIATYSNLNWRLLQIFMKQREGRQQKPTLVALVVFVWFLLQRLPTSYQQRKSPVVISIKGATVNCCEKTLMCSCNTI